jgi:hypothetical protein
VTNPPDPFPVEHAVRQVCMPWRRLSTINRHRRGQSITSLLLLGRVSHRRKAATVGTRSRCRRALHHDRLMSERASPRSSSCPSGGHAEGRKWGRQSQTSCHSLHPVGRSHWCFDGAAVEVDLQFITDAHDMPPIDLLSLLLGAHTMGAQWSYAAMLDSHSHSNCLARRGPSGPP